MRAVKGAFRCKSYRCQRQARQILETLIGFQVKQSGSGIVVSLLNRKLIDLRVMKLADSGNPVVVFPERAFYRSQQETMTARFGTIWPGRAVNPLDTEYSRINSSLYDSPEQHKYALSSPHYIQLDSRPARPFRFRVRRKYRKLMRSPKAFFRDALQNHFSGWRRNSL